MRRFLATILASLAWSSASAQTYVTPQPATTSAPVLREEARTRLISERFHRGLAALDAKRWGEAVAEFAAIVALHPHEPQGSTAAYDLGLAYYGDGRLNDAARAFSDAIARDPQFLAAMANLVAVDLQRRDVREARSIADRFAALAPDSARALYSRGLAALAGGDLAVARDDFSQLLKRNPRYAVAYYDLGIAEVRIGIYTAAQSDFEAALALAPNYARARFALGTLLLRSGDRAGARAAFDRAAHDAVDDAPLRALATEMRDAMATGSR